MTSAQEFNFILNFRTLKATFIFLIGAALAEQSFIKLKFIAITVSKLLKLINERIYKVNNITTFLLTCGEQMCWEDPAIQKLRQSTFKTTYDDDEMALNTMKALEDIRTLMKHSEFQ